MKKTAPEAETTPDADVNAHPRTMEEVDVNLDANEDADAIFSFCP